MLKDQQEHVMPQQLDPHKIAQRIRQHLVEMMNYSRSSHIGSCLSIVDTLVVLYFKILKINPADPKAWSRDKFILSKAHASAALYATLAEAGFFDLTILQKYYIDGGVLPGHLDRTAVPGVETSGGSLGHGLAIGLGMAIANTVDNNPGKIFVLLGDGECNEGSVWEGAMLGGHLALKNISVLIDFNKIQSLGNTEDILNQTNLAARWTAFGWNTIEIDGHNLSALETSLAAAQHGPRCFILHTIKGKGVSFMENKLLWHYRSPNDEEKLQALEELKKT